jgi:hypothetical protein
MVRVGRVTVPGRRTRIVTPSRRRAAGAVRSRLVTPSPVTVGTTAVTRIRACPIGPTAGGAISDDDFLCRAGRGRVRSDSHELSLSEHGHVKFNRLLTQKVT